MENEGEVEYDQEQMEVIEDEEQPVEGEMQYEEEIDYGEEMPE